MTITTVINSVMLAVGPVIATFLALGINDKEGGQATTLKAILLNLGCIAVKLTLFAFIAPILTYSSGIES